MATTEKTIASNIATLERELEQVKGNATATKAIKAKISRLNDELKGISIPARQLANTLLKARKTVKELAKKDFNDLIKRLAKKDEYSFLKGYTRNEVLDDIDIKAKPSGWRFKGRGDYRTPTATQIKNGKKAGTVYKETRPKRSDVSQVVQLEKGGYAYIPKDDIKSLSAILDGELTAISPKSILSGAYIKTLSRPNGKYVLVGETKDGYWTVMSKPTTMKNAKELLYLTSPVKGEVNKIVTLEEAKNHKKIVGAEYLKEDDSKTVSTTDISSLRERILNYAKEKKKDSVKTHGKFIKDADLTAFRNTGLTDDMIMAFYCGMRSVIEVEGDTEVSELSGIFQYGEDYLSGKHNAIIEKALSFCKENKFELGLKYPEYNFNFLPKPTTKFIDGTSANGDITHYKTWTFKTDNGYIVAGKTIGKSYVGKKYREYDKRTVALKDGYLSFVSSNPKAVFNILKEFGKQKDGYIKDVEWLYNNLGGVDAQALDQNNMKYARGGFVGKGEHVWRQLSNSDKLKFLYENFTPSITPRSQEILVGKAYNFLPKNVKIVLNAKYANVEEYAEGGKVKSSEETYFVQATTANGDKVAKFFKSKPTHKQVYDYFKKSKRLSGESVIIKDATIKVEKVSGFDSNLFIKKADQLALKMFGSKIKSKDNLMFTFDATNFNVVEFDAELENGSSVKISAVDGVIIIEQKFETGGGINTPKLDLENIAHWGGTTVDGVKGILSALVESGLTTEGLQVAKSKSGSAYQNRLAKKTTEVWKNISSNYKGDLKGNRYYSTLYRIIEISQHQGRDIDVIGFYSKLNETPKFENGGDVWSKIISDYKKGVLKNSQGETVTDKEEAYKMAHVAHRKQNPSAFHEKGGEIEKLTSHQKFLIDGKQDYINSLNEALITAIGYNDDYLEFGTHGRTKQQVIDDIEVKIAQLESEIYEIKNPKPLFYSNIDSSWNEKEKIKNDLKRLLLNSYKESGEDALWNIVDATVSAICEVTEQIVDEDIDAVKVARDIKGRFERAIGSLSV